MLRLSAESKRRINFGAPVFALPRAMLAFLIDSSCCRLGHAAALPMHSAGPAGRCILAGEIANTGVFKTCRAVAMASTHWRIG